ncbi:alpha/beta fold hydrolase [Actinacidiphila bryophytorum]|uniref:Pimeloyl-ACP methyl ester carboxylesterase n=1 Tax=Actinacidiphila bryophytorum TaxID=1436133 RepID=A0A9W4ECL3_9ACTN|nr:alpha/beta hydrolase [Actinacidiphila bryophytorum]MBM9440860.1 alpha/beta hydrolase [Actinacidiphila bryophytorum]MBN6545357.1 alpha/beta hydrolase [Actinacidiphila bryophytorum]CAG7604305.1 Pimeloyl-ACP methyl ester carboxylesterase [Actinacidiphila bryophytorum]
MPSTDYSQAAAPPAAVPPAGPVLADGETSRTVRLPGLALLVRSRAHHGGRKPPADREPAMFVHGLGGSSQNWSALMASLADTVEGHALDLPGFGHSPPPDDGNYSVAAHARAVVRLLEEEGRGPVHLFGNSLGGAVTVKVAAARPDLVRTLTLVSPALPELPPQRTALPTALASVPGLPALYVRATRGWQPERRTQALLSLCYGDPSVVGDPERAAYAAEYQRRIDLPYFWDVMIGSTRGIVNAYTLGGQHSLWRQAERVLAPTLLVYGVRDKLVSVRMARRASRAFRDSRLLTIPGSGHVAMMEHPHLVDRAFRDLRDEIAARARSGAAGGTVTATTDMSTAASGS